MPPKTLVEVTTLEDIQTAITFLQEEHRQLGVKMNVCQNKLRVLIAKGTKLLFNVEVGSIVKNSKGTYKVIEINNGYYPKRPFLTAVRRRPNGTFGVRKKYLFEEWEVV